MPDLRHPASPPSCLCISYVHGGSVFYQPGDTLGPRVLSDYEIVLIIDGHVDYCANDQTYSAPPGTLILARPGFHEFYRWDSKRHTHHAFFHFQLEKPLCHWPKPESWPIVVTQPAPVCIALMQHVVKLCITHPNWPMERPGPEVCCLIKTLIETLFAESQHIDSTAENARPQTLQRAIQWMRRMIEEDPEQPPQLKKLAAASGVTPKHLCRLFREHLDSTPMTVYRLLRLQLALALLTRSNLIIKQIANRCGFASQFQFSRSFSKAFGRAPTAMREYVQRGAPPPAAPLPPDLMPRIKW